jgi:hypothetical protein
MMDVLKARGRERKSTSAGLGRSFVSKKSLEGIEDKIKLDSTVGINVILWLWLFIPYYNKYVLVA